MATVNKASLRTEFDALKARFESLCAEGKMSPESRALVDALLMLFELLMAVFMEKHTPKSSANSGLPPSQSPNDATARTRPGAKGKGPSYNEARCANTRTREHVRVLGVDCCARCGEDLTDTACTGQPGRPVPDTDVRSCPKRIGNPSEAEETPNSIGCGAAVALVDGHLWERATAVAFGKCAHGCSVRRQLGSVTVHDSLGWGLYAYVARESPT